MLSRISLVLFLTLALSNCTALSALKAGADVVGLGGPETGLEVDANVGQAKTEGDSSVAQNANTAVTVASNTKEVYEGSVGQVINEAGLPVHVLLIIVLLAGWAIPSPEEMGHGLIRLIRALRNTSR